MKPFLFYPILFIYLLTNGFQAIAQQKTNWGKRGYSMTGIGYGVLIPKLKNGASASTWNGIFFRTGGAEISFYTGKLQYTDDSLIVRNTNGYKVGVGFHAPLASLAIGHRAYGIHGMVLCPFIAGDIGSLGAGKAHGIAINFAPGYALQLPFGGIQVQLNCSYNFYDKFTEVDQLMGRTEMERSITKGFVLSPSVNIYLDGLIELLPVIAMKGTMLQNTKMDEYLSSGGTDYVTDNRGNVWAITSPYDESILSSGEWKRSQVSIDVVKSVWGIAPVMSVKAPSFDKANSFMYGLGFSFRKGVIGMDASYEKGQLGATAPSKPGIGNGNYAFQNYYSIKQSTIGLGIDMMRIIALSMMVDADKKMKGKAFFERFIVGWRFASREMTARVVDSIPANALYDEKDVYVFLANEKTKGFVNYPYASLEFGTVTISAEYLSKRNYLYANGVKWGVSCIFPIGGVTKALFGRKKN